MKKTIAMGLGIMTLCGCFSRQAAKEKVERLPEQQKIAAQTKKETALYYEKNMLRVKYSSLDANMHTLQTLVETYAVDWGGDYPENVQVLKQESSKANYWRSFKNPFTSKSGIGLTGSLIDHRDYKKGDSSQKGLVVYSFIKQYDGTWPTYKIYGIGNKGGFIQSKDHTPLVLSNS